MRYPSHYFKWSVCDSFTPHFPFLVSMVLGTDSTAAVLDAGPAGHRNVQSASQGRGKHRGGTA